MTRLEPPPPAREGPSPSAPRGAERIRRLILGACVVVLALVQGVLAVRHSATGRVIGWRAAHKDVSWTVVEVRRGGPADHVLRTGDRVLAIDGVESAGQIGPRWFLGPHAAGRSYLLRVDRPGEGVREFRLAVPRRDDRGFLVWAAIYYLNALVYLAIGFILIWQRPSDATVRFGYYACLSIALVMLHFTSRRYDAALSGVPLVISQLLLAIYPLHFLFGFLFLAGFPVAAPRRGQWRSIVRIVTAASLAVWLTRLTIAATVAAGDRGTAVLSTHPWIATFFDRVVIPVDGLLVVTLCIACLAVSRRNYRALADEVQRRRMRWVAVGLSAAIIPIALVQTVALLTGNLEAGETQPVPLRLARQVANALVIMQPVAMAYAVLRHRVMGLSLAVRIGVQYVLAKSALQVVLVLPLLSLAIRGIARPQATVMNLLFGDGAWWNSAVLVGAAVALRYRSRLGAAVDRRFFREAYDQERVLLDLVERIPEAESVDALSRRIAVQLHEALHVARVHVMFVTPDRATFETSYSSDGFVHALRLHPDGSLWRLLERDGAPAESRAVALRCTEEERAFLEREEIELVVPVQGVDGRLRGLVLLGAKRSEEPYTAKDRALLRTIATQVGSVHEVLSLRAEVSTERRVQHEVFARLAEARVQVLRECRLCGECYGPEVATCERDGGVVEASLPIPPVVDGRYRLERRIGRGGMGTVYRGTDLRLGRPIALKVMLGYLFGSSTAQRRFEREARLSARLEHPNIVRTYDYGVFSSGGAFLVFEYVDGASWRQLIAERPLTPSRLAPLLAQLCDGIAAAHLGGVIHRDLKPENILVVPAEDGAAVGERVKVLDFGLAKSRTGDRLLEPETSTSVVHGTVGYIAPELVDGAPARETADIYSVGVIALESLLGREVLHRDLSTSTLQRLVELRLAVPALDLRVRALSEILRRAVERDPNSRYRSIEELRRWLIPALEEVATDWSSRTGDQGMQRPFLDSLPSVPRNP